MTITTDLAAAAERMNKPWASYEHDVLMRAVVATPDDDLPRLILADWYEENGEDERAANIRQFVAYRRAVADFVQNTMRVLTTGAVGIASAFSAVVHAFQLLTRALASLFPEPVSPGRIRRHRERALRHFTRSRP